MNDRIYQAKKVTWVGFIVNLLLTFGKLLAGLFGRSAAMVADGVHSLSDFATDMVVLLFIGISGKDKDKSHDYGHGKFETFATLIISIVLIAVGFGICWSGITKILDSVAGKVIAQPSIITLIAAVVSIIAKEALYWYTITVGKRIKSDVVIANGWHHRSDALSSIGTMSGIGGAIFLGEKWRVLDPIASIIVSIFIVIAGVKILIPAIKELLESSLSDEMEEEISSIIMATSGVKAMHNLKTRKSGSNYIIDVHIKVDSTITIVAAHDIASAVEASLRDKYGKGVQTSIHTEPYWA